MHRLRLLPMIVAGLATLTALAAAPGLPPIAALDYQTQPRQFNALCMHVATCNALRAVEYQATGRDPGDLSPRFVGLSAVEEGWLDSPDDPFGPVGASRLAYLHGSCRSDLCSPDATAKSSEAIRDAAAHRTVTMMVCETMADVRDAFAAGPCAIGVNRHGHAYTIVTLTANGDAVVVDPFPDWRGRAKVTVWPAAYCERLVDKSLGYWDVVAFVGFGDI